VHPVPDPLPLRKSGSAGNRTRDLCICSQKLWPLDQRGGLVQPVPYFNVSVLNYIQLGNAPVPTCSIQSTPPVFRDSESNLQTSSRTLRMRCSMFMASTYTGQQTGNECIQTYLEWTAKARHRFHPVSFSQWYTTHWHTPNLIFWLCSSYNFYWNKTFRQ